MAPLRLSRCSNTRFLNASYGSRVSRAARRLLIENPFDDTRIGRKSRTACAAVTAKLPPLMSFNSTSRILDPQRSVST